MLVPLAETAPTVDPSTAGGVFSLLWVIIALPALGAAVLLLLGNDRTRGWAHLLGCATVLASFVISLVAFVALLGRADGDREIGQKVYDWVDAGSFHVDFSLLFDPLSALFLLLITGVGSLIHIYSVGYMAHDERRPRFFAYLNLFVASMLTLVLADNYLVVFLGWEGVGLASYLLIGFWQYKPSAAVAAKKAFVVNRVGDIGMALGTMLIFATFGTVTFAGVSAAADRASDVTLTVLGLLFLLAACGKSAQVPLQSWLLDAMEG
ncbi:MAG TPA: proton-conducting transporter membrane subunit, partial [Nocardioidaceae bacterium]|nr:proton-conducting transporter membrane subunit [Nocardioidaceae bacterium]